MRWSAIVASLVVGGVILVGCGDDPEPRSTPTTAVVRDVDESIEAAVRFIREEVAASEDPLVVADTAVNLDYLLRRFGDHVDLSWVATELTPRAIAFAAEPGTDPMAQQLDVFIRLVDPAAALPIPPSSLPIEGGSAVTSQALWCDVHPMPPEIPSLVSAAIEAGGYELTHAAAGLVIISELGCAEPAGTGEATERAIAALPGLLTDPADLSLEACGILGYLGRPDLIPTTFVDRVRAEQAVDGGWGQEPGAASTVHATEWGLRCLLEARRGAETPREPWAVGGSVLPSGA